MNLAFTIDEYQNAQLDIRHPASQVAHLEDHPFKMDPSVGSDSADEVDIDPAIAEAMGFSGFGAQHNKKRKFNGNDTFIDTPTVEESVSSHASKSNAVPLGFRGKAPDESVLQRKPKPGGTNQVMQADVSRDDLQAYRQGVMNENGHMVYFMPSFIEDPWKDLPPR